MWWKSHNGNFWQNIFIFLDKINIFVGLLNLGTWQGLYLNEHRDRGGSRKAVVTIMGTLYK